MDRTPPGLELSQPVMLALGALLGLAAAGESCVDAPGWGNVLLDCTPWDGTLCSSSGYTCAKYAEAGGWCDGAANVGDAR